jgi:hypothetical protein
MKVKTNVKAGKITTNHNQKAASRLKVKNNVKGDHFRPILTCYPILTLCQSPK